MSLAAGTMVNANVRLVEQLGEGGMGSVWLADHLKLEAPVAVKVISAELAEADPTIRERFKREANICARLRSLHVVQLFDHGVMEDNTPYIVMELLEGSTLMQVVEEEGPLAPRDVSKVVTQIAKVLHHAHKLGIVHRDIKPDNIFLTDSEYDLFVKVLDFGIAKQTRGQQQQVTKTGAVVGTPEFMSPEQALSSKTVDYRADLFSLGIVAYYALSGELPFSPSGHEPYWMQMSRGEHVPLSEVDDQLPAELDKWIALALNPDPAARFQSASAMATTLAAIIDPTGRPQVFDALGSSEMLSQPGRPGAVEEVSHPAMYDLLGPESDAFDRMTVLMDEEDHETAEARGEGPPTQRRPQRPAAPTASAAAYAAVRSGAYNWGIEGAYNDPDAPSAYTAAGATHSREERSDDAEEPETERLPDKATPTDTTARMWLLCIVTAIALVAAVAAILFLSGG